MIKVSIILPAYNAEKFISQTIASISEQTFADFEIIVVDDGSRDATAAIATAADPRVRVITQANQGIAQARNVGVLAAQGQYIAFMDHDDLWHPQKLETQVKLLELDASCAVVYGEFERWTPPMPPAFKNTKLDCGQQVPALSGMILSRLVETNWVLFSTAMFRRHVFDRVGLFDPTMPPADDWDFALRAAEQFKFVKLAQVVALYRIHAGQTSLKLQSRNIEYELRERTLTRLHALGQLAHDEAGVQQRQFHCIFNFGLNQYAAGKYVLATKTFLSAFKYRKKSLRVLAYLSLARLRSIGKTAED
ncbi:glycosyltransferase family A protein [Roseateles sp.]|uniref:glycosyltransferase family 2 protein n=1 Tax=Roseateles sp. TaxID=1971397 RepID=UPI00286A3192|nr:glycosyltransferase family A protein [Roseateles sp.]